MTDPSSPTITVAEQGVAATSDNSDSMRLQLSNGYVYETPAKNPDQSFTRGFNTFDLSIALPPSDTAKTPKELAPVYVMLAEPGASYVSGATVAVTGGKPIL